MSECKVKQFVEATKPDILTQELVLISEMNELAVAIATKDLNGMLDGICDCEFAWLGLNYLTPPASSPLHEKADEKIVYYYGTWDKQSRFVRAMGQDDWLFSQELMDEAFDIVCDSNLSKFDKTEAESMQTKVKYNKLGIETQWELINGLYITKVNGDHSAKGFPDKKIVKSAVNYFAPDFSELLKGIKL